MLGFIDGYEGLLSPINYKILTLENTQGIMPIGGTIIGTTNRGRFVAKQGLGEKAMIPQPIIDEAKKTLADLGVRALICIGGDGSLTTADQLFENGVAVVGVPKTIDNDLSATATTFGFDSAVQCVADALDRLHTTAASHKRVMVLEVMGRSRRLDRAPRGGLPAARRHPNSRDSLFLRAPRRPCREADVERRGLHAHRRRRRCHGPGHRRLHARRWHERAKSGSAASARRLRPKSASGPSARRAPWCSVTCNAAARPPRRTAISAPASASARCNLIQEKKFGCMVSYLNYQIGAVTIKEAVGQVKHVPPEGRW